VNSLPTYPSGVEGRAMDKEIMVEFVFAVGASAAGAAIAKLIGVERTLVAQPWVFLGGCSPPDNTQSSI
jgi:hypothetical protein